MKAVHGHSEDETRLLNITIDNVTQDSRKVKKRSCFLCIKGSKFDGHLLVQEAIEKGAVLIIASQPVASTVPVIQVNNTQRALAQLAVCFYKDPSKDLNLVGVTGTNGKTTITHMVAEIFNDAAVDTGIIGTMYNKIGSEKLPTINTTPDALTIQSLLAKMVKKNMTACVMEVSSHALVQGRVWGVDFNTTVFTNLSRDHLEFHHTFEEYFQAKSLLFAQMGNSYHQTDKEKYAIINADDPYGQRLVQLTAATVFTYGCKGAGDIQACGIKVSNTGTSFDLSIEKKKYPVRMKMIGDFNVYNFLAAFGVGFVQGIPPQKIIHSLEQLPGVKGRFQLVPNTGEVTVIVDYAHTPDGLLNVLSTIQKFAQKKIYCVVGCGGDRDPSKRPIMAEVAIKNSTHPVFTSDNPRTEDPIKIIDEMIKAVPNDLYEVIVERKTAIWETLRKAQSGDVVLIAGKGHEDYQIIGTEKHHFDDVEVVADFYRTNAEK